MMLEQRATGPTVDHATYVGGSDIAAIVGLSPYASPLDVWAEKTRRAKFEGNRRTRAGQLLEPGILSLYAQERGVDLWFPETIVTPEHTGCTPDAVSSAGYDVQVKLVGLQQAERWEDVPELGVGDENGIPPEVLAQIHYEAWHIAEVHGVRGVRGHVVAQIGTDQRVYEVEIDQGFAETLVDAGRRFWRDHVVTDRMPIVKENDRPTLGRIYPTSNGDVVSITGEVLALAYRYAELTEEIDRADADRETVGAQLCSLIGERSGFVGVAAGVRVTWNQQRGKIRWEPCARALGATDAIAERYRGEAHRVLRVSVKGR